MISLSLFVKKESTIVCNIVIETDTFIIIILISLSLPELLKCFILI